MDKEKFGGFVSSLRKEHGMTQKELAAKLYLTDKAVSKWERGLSYPDISILESLAETLDVTVLELLQGERMEQNEPITVEVAQKMVDESITLSDQEIHRKHTKSKTIILLCCVVVMFLVSFIMNITNLISDMQNTPEATTEQTSDLGNKDPDAYAVMENAQGETVFVNPQSALEQLLRDCEEMGCDEQLMRYLKILDNSLEKEAE